MAKRTQDRKIPSGFPLFLHRNGQWAKKVRSRARYFGTDRDEALRRWIEQKHD